MAALAAESVLVGLAYAALGPSAGSLLIYVSVMAVFLLPTRAGWAAVSVFVAVSLVVPWAHGWTVDETMAFQIFVAALAMWGVGHADAQRRTGRGPASAGPWRWPRSGPGSPGICMTSSVTA